jgi:hypothetical protein
MISRLGLALIVVLSLSGVCRGQKQLVFIRHGEVFARYTEGQTIRCVLKNKKHKEGFIVELEDFRMITSNDTINFLSIAKIDTRAQHGIDVRKGLGGLLFLGGIVYLSVDQINAALGYGAPGFDRSDWIAVAAAGVGAAMLFIRPKYQRLKPGTMIRAIDHRSPFFLRGF